MKNKKIEKNYSFSNFSIIFWATYSPDKSIPPNIGPKSDRSHVVL